MTSKAVIHFEPAADRDDAWASAVAAGVFGPAQEVGDGWSPEGPAPLAKQMETGLCFSTYVLVVPVRDPGPAIGRRTVDVVLEAPSFEDNLALERPGSFVAKLEQLALAADEQVTTVEFLDDRLVKRPPVIKPAAVPTQATFAIQRWGADLDGHSSYDDEVQAAVVAGDLCFSDPFLELTVVGRLLADGDPRLLTVTGKVVSRTVSFRCTITRFAPPADPLAVTGWVFSGQPTGLADGDRPTHADA